ncbi:MAG: AAA family ATPase, partial [Deltaproteobacteria bacterium]
TGTSGGGEITVGPNTHRLTRHLFDFETIGPFHPESGSDAVPVYRLGCLKPAPRHTSILTSRGIASPLIGRKAELSVIRSRIDRLTEGEGGIISVVGTAGIGKSRLIAEARDGSVGADPPYQLEWLEGRTLSFGKMISYLPFHEILLQYADIAEDDSEELAWDKLQRRLTALFGNATAEILPYLARFVSLEVSEDYRERVGYLDGEAMRRQIFFAWRRLVGRMAQDRPLILVFEDLQWIDESSATLLEHMLSLAYRGRVLLVILSRPTVKTPAARILDVLSGVYHERYTAVHLSPLSSVECGRFVANLLHNESLLSSFPEMVNRKSEGNPFFVEEIIRSMIDHGQINPDRNGARWQLTAEVDEIAIPDTIQGVVMARVDRLDDELKGLLRFAAIIGRTFQFRILLGLAPSPAKLEGHLKELQSMELIRQQQDEPEFRLVFKHALVHETIYQSILPEERRTLHRQVGAIIEQLFHERLEEFYSLLAYHFARAEAWEKAQEYLFKAGDQAGSIAADAEALVHYEHALAAYAQAFGEQWMPLKRVTVERKIGEAFFRMGEREQAMEHFQRSLTHLGKPLLPRPHRTVGRILRELAAQVWHRSVPWLLPEDRPALPAVQEEIRIFECMSWMDAFYSTWRFLFDTVHMLNVSERNGFGYGIVRGCTGLGITSDFIRFFWLARFYHRRAVAVAEGIGHSIARGWGYLGSAIHTSTLCSWDETFEYCEKASEVFHKVGDLHSWAYVQYMRSFALAYLGDYARALGAAGQTLDIGEGGGDLEVKCWAKMMRGFVLLRLGKFIEAEESLRETMNLAKLTKDRVQYTAGLHELAVCHVRQGQWDHALEEVNELERFLVQYPNIGFLWIPSRNVIGEVYLRMAEQSQGRENEQWLDKASSACRHAYKHSKGCIAMLPEAMRLLGTFHWLKAKPGAAQSWWNRSLSLARKLEHPHETAMTLLEMGRRLNRLHYLEQAESIFADHGAAWYVAEVRRAKPASDSSRSAAFRVN